MGREVAGSFSMEFLSLTVFKMVSRSPSSRLILGGPNRALVSLVFSSWRTGTLKGEYDYTPFFTTSAKFALVCAAAKVAKFYSVELE